MLRGALSPSLPARRPASCSSVARRLSHNKFRCFAGRDLDCLRKNSPVNVNAAWNWQHSAVLAHGKKAHPGSLSSTFPKFCQPTVEPTILHFYRKRVFRPSGLKTLDSSTLADFPLLIPLTPGIRLLPVCRPSPRMVLCCQWFEANPITR